MTEQQENELLCEKLLGWRHLKNVIPSMMVRPENESIEGGAEPTPTFVTSDGMLMLLEAMAVRGQEPTLEYSDGKWDCYGGDPYKAWLHATGDTAPAAVRAAALEYVRTLSCVCECIPLAPRPYKFCQACGGRITQPPGDGQP